MSKPDQNILKVLEVVCHLFRTKLGFHTLWEFLSDASHIQLDTVWDGSGGGVWVGVVIGIEPLKQASWEVGQGWKGDLCGWLVYEMKLSLFSLLCYLVRQYPAVWQGDRKSRTSIMDCWKYKSKKKSEISEEESFIGPQISLNFNLLSTITNIHVNLSESVTAISYLYE